MVLYATQGKAEQKDTLCLTADITEDAQYTVTTLYELWTVIRITEVNRVMFQQPNGRAKIVQTNNGNLMKTIYNKLNSNQWL